MRLAWWTKVILSGGLIAPPVAAHHSFAMFDQQKTITLKGTVKEFQWVNPHSWIQLYVNGTPRPVEWSIEMGGPSGLVRQGWKRTTLKPGDMVTLQIHPLRSGQPGGSYLSVLFPDGHKLGADQVPPAAAE